MENFNLLLPDNFQDLEKNHENVYSVRGTGKTFSKQDFRDFSEQFSRKISKDPTSIAESELYEPAYYLTKLYTRDPAYSKILEKVVLTVGANFHKILNSITEPIKLEDEMVQSFTKLMVILLNFLEKAIANKNDEDLLDEDGEIKKKKKKDAEGHTLTDLVKNVLLKFKDLCFGLIFRPLLVKAPGVGRLLYKGIKQCMKDSLAIYEDKLTEEQNSAQHIYLILQELIQLDVIKVYGLQYDLSMLVNDVEICHKTVGSFLIQCSRSRNSKMYELCSSTLVFILKKHCMAKSKLVSESNSVRYYRQFFEFLAPELPDVFHTHLQEFLYLFDSQCHPLRNAAVEILKQIIIHKCGQVNSAEAKDEELGKNTEELRRELLDWILQRTADKSSWCRLTAVTTLHELMVLKMIHSDYVEKVFEKAAKHIKDPTSIVRKKAMVLASEILTFYISTMEFPNEDVIEPELQNIRSRKTEFAKRNEDPSASAAEKDEMTNQILLAMKYEQIFEFYKKTYQIVGALVPQIVSLMFRSSTDSLEAIRLLVKMKSLGYNKVDAHFPKMYTLIWSEDAAITEEIKSSFISLYVNKERKQNACRNICSLLKLCDKSTKICVLRVVKVLFEGAEKNRRLDQKNKTKYVLEEEFIPLFWTYFQEKFENAKNAYEEEDYRLALKVIAEGLFYFPRWFYSIKKQDTIYLMKIYLSKIKKIVDWEVIADICKIISKTKSHFDQNDTTHVLILKSIEEIIYINQGVGDLGWYTATQSFVQAVFDVSKCPEIYIEIFFKKISNFLGHQSELSFDQLATKLSQLIWTSGEVALKLLARIEDVEELLKKKHTDPEKSKKGMAIESGGAAEEPEELDQAMGGFDGVYQSQREILHEIAESKIIYDNVIGAMMPIVRNVVQKIINNKGNLSNGAINTALAHCCTVTLFKFAAISKKFCHESIETVIELIQKDMDSALVVKSLLGLSDLIKRTPQIVEPFSHRLFETLDSPHRSVKKISMIIITHLILNDLLKIKGEIVDIIMKLIDPDIEIRKFTELFLIQLHKKDPMIINNLLPDTLTRFSTNDNVTPEMFEKFAQNLLGFIDKEKQAGVLAENLIQRFRNKDNIKELVLTSICINIISNNLSVFKVLEANADVYCDKLYIPEIKKQFKESLEKLKNSVKNVKRKGGALQVDALEDKLRPFMEVTINGEGGESKLPLPSSIGTQPGFPTDLRKKKTNQRLAAKKVTDMDEESSNSKSKPIGGDEEDSSSSQPVRRRRALVDEEEEEESQPTQKSQQKKRSGANTQNNKKKKTTQTTTGKKKAKAKFKTQGSDEEEDYAEDDEDDEEYTN